MNITDYKDSSFFVGGEASNTPAFSKKTLFVIGKQSVTQMLQLAKDNKVAHVSLGVNYSFDIEDAIADKQHYWNNTIKYLLSNGLYVTLNYASHQHEQVLPLLSADIWHSRLFIPLLSIQIPNIENTSANLTVKIDDTSVNKTNPGIWCMHFKEITDSNRFTSWSELAIDKHIETVVEDVISPEISLNDSEAGLDRVSTTALVPDIALPQTLVAPKPVKSIRTAAAAADAYTAGTIKDALSSKPVKTYNFNKK